jgi:hypothetical protein
MLPIFVPCAASRQVTCTITTTYTTGAYSQIGVDASWSLNWDTVCTFGNPGLCAPKPCSECTEEDMMAYRKMYWGLSKTFNPTKFNASVWADAAAGAGMKYVVMTTKHCDGFAMFNTSARGAPGQVRRCSN